MTTAVRCPPRMGRSPLTSYETECDMLVESGKIGARTIPSRPRGRATVVGLQQHVVCMSFFRTVATIGVVATTLAAGCRGDPQPHPRRRAVRRWTAPVPAPCARIDATRRHLQRAYLDEVNEKINPPATPLAVAQGGGQGPPQRPPPPPVLPNSDAETLLRGELVELDAAIRTAVPRAADRTTRLHTCWGCER